MPKLNPRLHLYIRLDGSGNAIPGSVVRRKSMPKMGKWVDITPCVDVCGCFTSTTTSTTTSS